MKWSLVPCLLPYLGLVSYDAALHPRRRVPPLEFGLHVVAAVLIGSFLISSLLGGRLHAWILLLLAVPVMLADEFGFHGRIGKHERRVHQLAFLALLGYTGAWVWMQ